MNIIISIILAKNPIPETNLLVININVKTITKEILTLAFKPVSLNLLVSMAKEGIIVPKYHINRIIIMGLNGYSLSILKCFIAIAVELTLKIIIMHIIRIKTIIKQHKVAHQYSDLVLRLLKSK